MSQTRYLKNMITPTLVEPTENHEAAAASGVWSLGEQLEARRGSVWPEAGITDPSTLIENNFATTLYTGNGAAQTITTGIDLSGNNDGLVWIKRRDDQADHSLFDTKRGVGNRLQSHSNAAQDLFNDSDTESYFRTFNNDGFSVGHTSVNASGGTFTSWTFKKAPKFFDVVTYTGTGSAKTVAHSLGGTVGMILVKNLGQTDSWAVYHRGMDDSAPQNYDMHIDTNAARSDDATWNDTAPTSSVFSVGTDHMVNADGENYVAYLFAHETGSDSMIKCDKFTAGAGSLSNGEMDVDLGFEPQFVMIKNRQSADSWIVYDTMRGYFATDYNSGADGIRIRWDTNAAEAAEAAGGHPNASGFATDGDGPLNNHTYIYMAIRRPNMATITDATEVFAIDAGNGGSAPDFTSGFPVDFAFYKEIASGDEFQVHSRLQGPSIALSFDSTNAEDALGGTDIKFDLMTGYHGAGKGSTYYAYMWKRAKGYFDVVTYKPTQSGSGNEAITHGLGVVPEMIWVKVRDAGGSNDNWAVYHANMSGTPYNNALELDNDQGTSNVGNQQYYWAQAHTNTAFYVYNGQGRTGDDGQNYIAFLFATLAGVSKCGGVTHSGSSTDVDCGFTAGARFVLLKRHDANGDWFVWDSTRGIVAGNDPYFLLNDDAAQVTNTDLIDPLASGFQISGDFTDGDYIFYAIA